MSFRFERQTSSLAISAINEANQARKFNLSPPYQRKSVWDDDRQSFFIDSLLRNYPVPPIFLKRIIDDATGNTEFEVVDGKQRLTSIFRYINNEIPSSSEDEQENEIPAPFIGTYFRDLDRDDLTTFKRAFWRYAIPVEYIDDINEAELNRVFDRLNRNGMPLNKQELRNAKYHNSKFVAFLKSAAQTPFWSTTLQTIAERERAEDTEFIADISFVLLEREVNTVEGSRFDDLFEKWAVELERNDQRLADLKAKFELVTATFERLELDLVGLKIRGSSHLYGVWSLLCFYAERGLDATSLGDSLRSFFSIDRRADAESQAVRDYFAGTTARTRSRTSRLKRLNALKSYVGTEAGIS